MDPSHMLIIDESTGELRENTNPKVFFRPDILSNSIKLEEVNSDTFFNDLTNRLKVHYCYSFQFEQHF